MALFYFKMKIISKGKGQSVVAASAYRSAEKLKEQERKIEKERNIEKETRQKNMSVNDIIKAAAYRSAERLKNQEKSITHNYTKKEHVTHKEIMLPKDAPEKLKDRQTLWNEINKIEKHKNAQLAREIVVALHRELDLKKNKELVRDYVQKNFTNKGLAADITIHNSPASDGKKNPHAHILLTTREIDKNGFTKTKNRAWNNKEVAEGWRKSWADHSNEKLKEAGTKERIDHRSYEERGIDKVPGIHMGKAATAMEKKGIKTELGKQQRERKFQNLFKQSLKIISDPEKRKEFEKDKEIETSRQWIEREWFNKDNKEHSKDR